MMRVSGRETRSVLTRIIGREYTEKHQHQRAQQQQRADDAASFRHGVNFEKAVLCGKGANVEQAFGKHGEAVGVAEA